MICSNHVSREFFFRYRSLEFTSGAAAWAHCPTFHIIYILWNLNHKNISLSNSKPWIKRTWLNPVPKMKFIIGERTGENYTSYERLAFFYSPPKEQRGAWWSVFSLWDQMTISGCWVLSAIWREKVIRSFRLQLLYWHRLVSFPLHTCVERGAWSLLVSKSEHAYNELVLKLWGTPSHLNRSALTEKGEILVFCGDFPVLFRAVLVLVRSYLAIFGYKLILLRLSSPIIIIIKFA